MILLVNPRAGNGILHPYTGNGGGGKLPPSCPPEHSQLRCSRTVEDIDER